MDVVCPYCGVANASAHSLCHGCGGALPASTQATGQRAEQSGQRKLIGAFLGLGALVIVAAAAAVLANRLAGPQQVEIVTLVPESTSIVQASMSGAEQHKYVVAARLTAAYVAVQPLKMMLTQYRMMSGDYPAELADIRIDAGELTDGEYITAVTLHDGGRLVTHLEPSLFGDGALFMLTPVDVMAGTSTRWDCTTTIPDEHLLATAGALRCEFDAALHRFAGLY
ncbi:MAG: hypothetical protein QNJ07_17110 [Woeseiaceae bacterium]|nr:hypothetical protein [Woeseiaceae bacterium]